MHRDGGESPTCHSGGDDGRGHVTSSLQVRKWCVTLGRRRNESPKRETQQAVGFLDSQRTKAKQNPGQSGRTGFDDDDAWQRSVRRQRSGRPSSAEQHQREMTSEILKQQQVCGYGKGINIEGINQSRLPYVPSSKCTDKSWRGYGK